MVAGVVQRLVAVGGAGLGETLHDAKLGGDLAVILWVGEGAGVLGDGAGGAVDQLLCAGGGEMGDFGVGLGLADGVGVDGGFGGALGEDGEGRVGGVAGGGEAGGGEDGFELAGADDGVDLGDVFTDLVAVALDQATGDDEALGSSSVGLDRKSVV